MAQVGPAHHPGEPCVWSAASAGRGARDLPFARWGFSFP